MPVTVRQLQADEFQRWDQFVRSHTLGSPFHESAWKECLESVYGYKPHYLMAVSGGEIVGVLPLFLVQNLLMGKVLLSTPFAVYGGVLASHDRAKTMLAEAAAELARKLAVEYLELRNSDIDQTVGFNRVDRYVTFHQEIAPGEEEILAAIPRKTRRMVRKALKCNYRVKRTKDLKAFFNLYSQSLRRLGTPCFPYRHFEELLRRFDGRADVREVQLDGVTVAAVLTFYHQDRLLPYYGASDPAYNSFAPNNYMYFELLRWGSAEGYRWFDFGRSKKESGSHDFKAHWGMMEKELPYEILLVKRREMPNFSPANPKYRLAIGAWRRLPLPVTRALGPWLVRLVP